MKHLKLLLMVIAVSLAYTGTSQELSRHVFCAGGGNYQSDDMHVSWTIGQAESVTTSYHSNANTMNYESIKLIRN